MGGLGRKKGDYNFQWGAWDFTFKPVPRGGEGGNHIPIRGGVSRQREEPGYSRKAWRLEQRKSR